MGTSPCAGCPACGSRSVPPQSLLRSVSLKGRRWRGRGFRTVSHKDQHLGDNQSHGLCQLPGAWGLPPPPAKARHRGRTAEPGGRLAKSAMADTTVALGPGLPFFWGGLCPSGDVRHMSPSVLGELFHLEVKAKIAATDRDRKHFVQSQRSRVSCRQRASLS